MELAPIPFSRKQGVVLDNGAFQVREVPAARLYGICDHGLVLCRSICLSYGVGSWAVVRG